MKILPVIMAGGSGTRLWPLSRENYPKQFIKIFNNKSLFQRALSMNVRFGSPIVIVGEEHRFIAKEQANEVGIEPMIIIEPIGKNTAPCAILAGLIADKECADIVLLLPADHYITDAESYLTASKEAANLALGCNVATIGINPSKPHTGYGYIELGELIQDHSFKVKNFVEKPNQLVAEEYIKFGNYCWNSGIFAFRPKNILTISEKLLPDMLKLVRGSIDKSYKDIGFLKLEKDFYSKITPNSIDYAIMEHVDNISVVKAEFGWNDLGSFTSIWEISDKDPEDNATIGDVITEKSFKNYVYTTKKLTTLVGVSDLIVVNTEDSVLVASKDNADYVKKIVSKLKKDKREEVKNSSICYRSWGSYQTIDVGVLHKVKRIIVKPLHKLSLQYHHYRAEHWVVVKGKAEVQLGKEIKVLNENDSIYIPIGSHHRLANIGSEDLHLIEVQTGKYLGEDDIVRLNDVY